MQKLLNSQNNLSPIKVHGETKAKSTDPEVWKEYSSFHDTFTELLSYENSRKSNSDFWQLNYI